MPHTSMLQDVSAGCLPLRSAAVALPAVDVAEPPITVRLHTGETVQMAGTGWPRVAYGQANADARGGQRDRPVFGVAVAEVSRDEVNELLEAWEHPLGAFRRLFAQQHFVMAVDGEPVALACSGSVRRPTVAGGIPRREVVELARVARHPDHRRAMRMMVRCWTDYLAPAWTLKYPDWPVKAVISYAIPGKEGLVYRFDGWRDLGFTRPWGGSTGWSGPSKASEIGDGRKRVWLYRYPESEPAAGGEVVELNTAAAPTSVAA